MHHIEIPQIGYVQEIPSDIAEFTTQQYLAFVELFLLLTHEKITYTQFRIKLLSDLMDFRPSKRKLSQAEKEIIHSEIFRLSELMDSFTTILQVDGKDKVQLKLILVKNLMPSIRTKRRILFGPSDALSDISFYEYIDAHNHYAEFLSTADEEALNRLIAVLYRAEVEHYIKVSRKENFDGQRRMKYNPGSVETRSREIAALTYTERFGVFLFFHGCEEFLREGEISLGDSRIRLRVLYDNPAMAETDETGLVGVLYTLAESQVFGNAQQTADTNLYDVLVRLYQLMKSYKRQEKAMHNG